MEALKIVCHHYDNDTIKQCQILKKNKALFENKLKQLNDELYDILWVSRRPHTKELFDEIYAGYNHIPNDKKNELWNNCKNTREKYHILFDKIKYFIDDIDLDEDDTYLYNSIRDMGRLEGMIGGIRAITTIYDSIGQSQYGCECRENRGDCHCNTDTELICPECSCYLCNKCVYINCDCHDIADDTIKSLLQLEFNLDS